MYGKERLNICRYNPLVIVIVVTLLSLSLDFRRVVNEIWRAGRSSQRVTRSYTLELVMLSRVAMAGNVVSLARCYVFPLLLP